VPSPADRTPAGPGWLHEIKHDGYRIRAHRDAGGVHLIRDWPPSMPSGPF